MEGFDLKSKTPLRVSKVFFLGQGFEQKHFKTISKIQRIFR